MKAVFSGYLFTVMLLIFSVSVLAATHEPVSVREEAGQPEDEFQRLAYISLRNISAGSDPEKVFGDERGQPQAGNCVYSSASLGFLEPLSGNGMIYIPADKISIEAVEQQPSDAFWRDFKAGLGGLRPLLYLHGYNTSFSKACKQAALFGANLGLYGRLLLYSWPSDGALLNYPRDEADVLWSVAPLEATLKRMVDEFGAGGFDVVAHSLGARGLFFALIQLAHGQYSKLPLIHQLVLTAADIDAGVFRQYVADIRPLVRNISVYVSGNDRPLALSREVHGYPRLGEAGPHLNDLQGIEIIDVSALSTRSFSGHLYHLYHDIVVQDLRLLFNSGKHATDRDQLEQTDINRWRLSE